MPSERTRNVLQAGIRQLAASQAGPKEVRQEAYRLLRHYPTVSDIEAIAEHEERLRALTQSARTTLLEHRDRGGLVLRIPAWPSSHLTMKQPSRPWKRDYVCGGSAGGFI